MNAELIFKEGGLEAKTAAEEQRLEELLKQFAGAVKAHFSSSWSCPFNLKTGGHCSCNSVCCYCGWRKP